MDNSVKFNSGLSYAEADALVEAYLSSISSDAAKLSVLTSFLKDFVRDSKRTREVVAELVGRAKRG
jgi:hypothetical protein